MPFGIKALRRLTEQGQEAPALSVCPERPLPASSTAFFAWYRAPSSSTLSGRDKRY
jgi:hypothetical protein